MKICNQHDFENMNKYFSYKLRHVIKPNPLVVFRILKPDHFIYSFFQIKMIELSNNKAIWSKSSKSIEINSLLMTKKFNDVLNNLSLKVDKKCDLLFQINDNLV